MEYVETRSVGVRKSYRTSGLKSCCRGTFEVQAFPPFCLIVDHPLRLFLFARCIQYVFEMSSKILTALSPHIAFASSTATTATTAICLMRYFQV